MKILVTGASGYLGKGIVDKLVNKGHEVIAAGFSSGDVSLAVKPIECDVFQIENPYQYFNEPDVLLHLAWQNGFSHYDDSHIENLPKHYHFIKEMLESGMKHIAIMGTMHEIGFFEGCINENTPCHPVTPYGISKNALRELCIPLAGKKDAVLQWMRGYYIVGTDTNGSSIFSKIAAAEERGEPLFPFTSGQNQYDFLDYDEFCNQVVTVIEQTEVSGIINICSGRPEKLADRVERFLRENNYRIKLNYGVYPDRAYDSKAIWGDDRAISNLMKKAHIVND